MGVLGVNFNKINLEKTGNVKSKITIRNNVIITDVTKGDINIGNKKQSLLKVGFEFTCIYSPKIAKIKLNGDLLVIEKSERIDELVKKWKKDKKLPKDVMASLLTSVIQKASIEALILSREVGLPAPIQLPKVNIK